MISSYLYRKLCLPIVDWARKTDSLAAFRFLEQSQWKSKSELKEIQHERLHWLLIHAEEHVPYYRELFKQVGFSAKEFQDFSDLKKIPFLNKDIIRREGKNLVADNAAQFNPRLHRSAGTTGQPIFIQMDESRHSVAWADMYRWWSAGGWKIGDKQFVIAGAALRPRALSGFKARLYSKLNHFKEFSSFNLAEDSLNRMLEDLNAYSHQIFLRGYASSVYTLAKHALSVGWTSKFNAPIKVFTTAETLFPEQRNVIMKGLNAEVFDQWGCRDGGISAFECNQHNGLHLAVENSLVEICSDSEPVSAGQSGEVVATDLFSYAMPIIRYKVGDIASYSAKECACGRGLPLIGSVSGRVSGFLTGTGGKRIHGEFFSHVFWETPWVKEFQIVQSSLETINVNIVKLSEPSGNQILEIQKLMEEQSGPECKIKINFVNEIPVGSMGKRQFVISTVTE